MELHQTAIQQAITPIAHIQVQVEQSVNIEQQIQFALIGIQKVHKQAIGEFQNMLNFKELQNILI